MIDVPEDSDVRPSTTVLGLGNLLRQDEGLGIRAMERLMAAYELPPMVQCVDGGTLGLDLLCYVENVEHLLIMDAVLTDGPPGTMLRITQDELPAFFGMRISQHEIALPDLLAVTRLRGTVPRELVFWGMQPGTIELGWGLTDGVSACLDKLAAAAADELRRWGLNVIKRSAVPTAFDE